MSPLKKCRTCNGVGFELDDSGQCGGCMLGIGKAPRHKFNAVATEAGGIKFGSKLEARVFEWLEFEKQVGNVLGFLRQVTIHLPGGIKYVLDFLVFYTDGRCEFVEAKGMETPAYKLKLKLLTETHPWIALSVLKDKDI